MSWNFLQDSSDPIFVGQGVQKLCPNPWIIHLWKSWLVSYNLFSWDIGLFGFLDLTFEPLDLQKSGWKNLAENFKTISKLMYFLKIDWDLAKLLPIEGGAILMAKVVFCDHIL